MNLEDLELMEDDALCALALEMPQEAKKLRAIGEKATLTLRMRMVAREATKLSTEHYEGALRTKGYDHYIDDPERLVAALEEAGLTREQISQAYIVPEPVVPSPYFDHRQLNDLHKLGGRVAEAIDRYRKSTPKTPDLELKVKA